MEQAIERANEIDFLKWFYQNADFGPADGDVRQHLKQRFALDTGLNLPEGYEDEPEEE